jgi:glutaredoxin 3
MNIEVFTKPACPNCTTAKQLLKSKGLEYRELDVSFPDWRHMLITKIPGARQMPAIFINDQYVGGLAGLQAALKQLGL